MSVAVTVPGAAKAPFLLSSSMLNFWPASITGGSFASVTSSLAVHVMVWAPSEACTVKV